MSLITTLLPSRRICLSIFALATAISAQAQTYNAGADLLANEKPDDPTDSANPNFTVPQWSYGYRALTADVSLTLFTTADHEDNVSGGVFDGFSDAAGSPCCGRLPSLHVNTGPVAGFPQGSVGTGELVLHPDGAAGGNFALEQKVVVRFTAPTAGSYAVSALWEDINDCCGTNNNPNPGVDVHVVINGVSVFDDAISREEGAIDPLGLPTATSFSSPAINLSGGDTVDFVVGTNGQLFGDATRFNATLTVPEPSTAILLGLSGAGLLARRRRA